MWQLLSGRVPILGLLKLRMVIHILVGTLISVPCSVSVRYSLDQAHCCGSVGGEA